MSEKTYKYEIEFSIKDIAENPNSSLSTKCIEILLNNEKLTIPEWFVIEKNLKQQNFVRSQLWILFKEMIKKLYNERRYDKYSTPALENVDDKKARINFDCEFNIYVPRTIGMNWRSQFKFNSGWKYVTVILKNGSMNKPKIIKKTDQHWLDFFEMFCKDMTQEASFDKILSNISRHVQGIIDKN